MIDPIQYISSSAENLYKFLFINGIILVLVSMFYPLKQKHDIELKVSNYNNRVEILNYKIKSQKESIIYFKKKSNKTIKTLDSLSKENKAKHVSVITNTKIDFNRALDSMKFIKRRLDLNNLELQGDKKSIKILINQAKTYEEISCYLLYFGIGSFLVGLWGWSRATNVLDKIKRAELDNLKLENEEKKKSME